jgi:hypothetical protein
LTAACNDVTIVVSQRTTAGYGAAGLEGNAVKGLEAGFSRYVAVRSANERIFTERKATYLPTV